MRTSEPTPFTEDPAAPGPLTASRAEGGQLRAATTAGGEKLLRALVVLAVPVLAENLLNIVVGLNDAYLANHLPADIRVDGTAAVGTVVYMLWFIGLFSGALGTGATAIVSRAIGAKHRGRANACLGQAVLLASVLGVGLGLFFLLGAPLIATLGGLQGAAHSMAVTYLRIVSAGAPFLVVLFVANAALRGAGDTRTPLMAMVVVNTVNVVLTWSLTFGYWGLPAMGIAGIATGTAAAYCVGAVMQVTVLMLGLGKLKLRFHRLGLNRIEMGRLLKIGLPSAAENAVMWGINFFMVRVVNETGTTAAAAHLNALRIESLSYMTGFAFAVATATMVGQSLGMKDTVRATRAGYYGYMLAGGAMGTLGLVFIFFGHNLADLMTEDVAVRDLTARCLFICGFAQPFFASYIIFCAALRGAGDTRAVLVLNFISMCGVRLLGVYLVGYVFHGSLPVLWTVLCSELVLRGSLAYSRFYQGGWKKIRV